MERKILMSFIQVKVVVFTNTVIMSIEASRATDEYKCEIVNQCTRFKTILKLSIHMWYIYGKG